jgi:hypothetical protein
MLLQRLGLLNAEMIEPEKAELNRMSYVFEERNCSAIKLLEKKNWRSVEA